jgi:hypothetical protein
VPDGSECHPRKGQVMSRRTRRDKRSLAADLAGDIGEATKLLQHSSQRLTERHSPTKRWTVT